MLRQLQLLLRFFSLTLSPSSPFSFLSPAIRCPVPSITNGRVNTTSTSLNYNGKVHFSCNQGFELIGQSVLTCSETEKWSNNYPSCVRVKCPDLGSLEFGYRNVSNFLFEAEVSFYCNVGYNLIGSKTRTCLANQTWSGTNTTCKSKSEKSLYIWTVMNTLRRWRRI